MNWSGDAEAFVRWCVDAHDLHAFRAALASLPVVERLGVAARLRTALAAADEAEPTRTELRTGAPLVERMRTPAAVLRRQIRLEKLRLLDEAVPSG